MIIKRCPHCMADLLNQDGGPCPVCGFDQDAVPQPEGALRRNTILHGKYLIGDVLGQGGFGITYIGFDLSLELKVAIKEYCPAGAAVRREGQNSLVWTRSQSSRASRQSAYDDFLKEARKMAKMDQNPSIVRVRETFLENETAYIVMDYVEGETLKSRLKREGVMKYSDCIALLRPLMEDLDRVHAQGIIHRDISPDNIMIQPDGRVKLLDLGAAKDLTLQKEGVSQLVTKKGFSPFEQYMDSGKIGPWTDVYALCATIYYACYGRVVPAALERLEEDNLSFDLPAKEPLPGAVRQALEKGLAVRAKDRTQSVKELLEQLDKEEPASSDEEQTEEESKTGPDPAEEQKSAPEKSEQQETAAPARRRAPRWALPAAAAAAVAVIVFGVYALLPGSSSLSTYTPASSEAQAGTSADSAPEASSAASSEETAGAESALPESASSPASAPSEAASSPEAASSEPAAAASASSEPAPQQAAQHTPSEPDRVQDLAIAENGQTVGSYTGQVANGVPSGSGKMAYANGDVYEGEWSNGRRNGQGFITFADGRTYQGSWFDDVPNGQGLYVFENGDRYEGEIANDTRNGQGVYTWASGDRYEGSWANDMANGYGVITFVDGTRYEGNFTNDQMNGKGTLTFPNGGQYAGDWVNNVVEGYGIMDFVNGDRYEGEWSGGVIEGQGVYSYANGNRYEGEWADGKKNGYGVMVYASLEERYEGNWLNDQRSGYGVQTSTKGDRYEGNWADNWPDGEGTMTYADGRTISKVWHKEEFTD